MVVTITFLDILILLGLFGGAVLGFFRGFLRQAAATLILYVSIVMASLFYRNLSRMLVRLTGQSPQSTDLLAFFVLLAVVMVVLFIGRRDLMRNANTDRIPIWQNIVGMVFGVLNAAIVAGVVLIVLRSTTLGDPWPAYGGLQTLLRRTVTRSFMAYVFGPFIQLIVALIEPWLFGGQLPPLLRNAI
jgi:uncharacterized membrane protein required for colicin V production